VLRLSLPPPHASRAYTDFIPRHLQNDKFKNMNFCETFFNEPMMIGTKERMKECDSMTLREAQRTLSATLIHELTHTKTAMEGGPV
jgi:hypothetical protein